MIRKSVILLLFLWFFAASALAAPLRLGILPVLDTLPLHVAATEGLFAEVGLDVELVRFQSALERDTAMQSGRLDGYFGDLLATLLLIQSGVPMRIATVAWVTSPGQRMFALMSAPGQKREVERLKTGISRASVIDYLLDYLRGLPGVQGTSLDGVVVQNIPLRLQMLLSGQIDAAVLPEPLAFLAESRGAVVLGTDEKLGAPLTVICLHASRRGDVAAFMEAYGKAVARINTAPESYRRSMVAACRIPDEIATTFPVYRYPEPRLPTREEVGAVQDWMLRRRLLTDRQAYAALVP